MESKFIIFKNLQNNNNDPQQQQQHRYKKQNLIQRITTKNKKKKNALTKVPDELLIYIFRFLSAQELSHGVALTCKRTGILWLLSVQNFKISGKIRKLKEDNVISVIKK
jgi:hypothetical protein